MKHIDIIASLLRSKFVMSGMRVGYDTHDSQPTVNRRSRLTSQQRHYSVTSARVAQEWLKYAAIAVMLFTIAVGNVWGADTNTPTSGSSYRFKATISGTNYYLVAPTTTGLGTATTTEADGTIFTFTKESSNWYITFVSSGTTYYMYESGTNGQVSINTTKTNVSTVTTNGTYAKIGGSKWIQLNGSTSPKRFGCYSSSQTGAVLSPVATEPKYTLKVSNGLGGYTTYSNKVKSDLTESTAMGGHECSGDLQGAYSGWLTSALETPAVSLGTTYNHATADAMPASGSTLYAVYYSTGEGGYLTNTLCEETCSNTVTLAAGTKTNVTTIAFDEASVETCSETASDRQVTVTITPASCYAVPLSTRLSVTGATYVSGPADNGDGTYSFVYQFAQNATGSKTFNASLSTTASYTVNYNKGTYGTGSNTSDTKTCGVNLTLPSSAIFTREGYTQQGWSTSEAGNAKTYNLGADYTTDAATTLYPYWEVNSYTVTWKVNNTIYSAGGSSSVNHGSHVETLPTPPDPASYCGQRFMGWTTSEIATPQNSAPSPLYKEASEFPNATGAQTFHAVFADYDE